MIRRVTPNRHASLEPRSSCCGFDRKRETKNECQFEMKPKDFTRNLTLSTPYRDFTIVEDDFERGPASTPRPTNPTPKKLFSNKEQSARRISFGVSGQKALSSVYTAASPSAVLMADDFVGRPLERLKDRRKNTHISNPLSISLNSPNIRFTYSANTTKNIKRTEIVFNPSDIVIRKQSQIEKEVCRLQEELRALLAETERLKQQKTSNIEQYRTILAKLSQKEEEIRVLQKMRREEVAALRGQVQRLLSSIQED